MREGQPLTAQDIKEQIQQSYQSKTAIRQAKIDLYVGGKVYQLTAQSRYLPSHKRGTFHHQGRQAEGTQKVPDEMGRSQLAESHADLY